MLFVLGASPRCHPRTGASQYEPVRLQSRPARPRRSQGLRAIPSVLGEDQAAFLVRQRVARLATSDGMGKPHAVPVCFALAQPSIYIALDEKPKDVPATSLKRVRNILDNPDVALIADRYTEEWNLLAFVMVRGRAELLDPDIEEHAAAVRLLRGKYHQYETMRIEENPVIAIRSEKAASWGALDEPDTSGPQVLDTIHGRRSIRRYLQKRVLEDLVERVLEAARWAPSPHGRQPWRFAVITQGKTRERLAGAMGEVWRANLEMDDQSPEVVERGRVGARRR